MKIGIMTGGGDAPGLNGIIEASSRTLIRLGHEVIGVLDGFEGIFARRTRPIRWQEIIGIHAEAGTFLGTSNKTRVEGRSAEFQVALKDLGLDGLIAAGGDGTFQALSQLSPELPLIGVPKTIDNDLQGTEITFGYDTACSVVADAVDALRATAHAHQRIMVVETMGRTAGWIALGGGLASSADAILIGERPYDPAELRGFLLEKKQGGTRGLVLVVAESAHPRDQEAVTIGGQSSIHSIRYGGVGERLARWIEQETLWEARHVVLGHLQRSRAPTTTDRFLSASMGIRAAHLAHERKWNRGVAYRLGRIEEVPLTDFQGSPRRVAPDHRWVRQCQDLGIFI